MIGKKRAAQLRKAALDYHEFPKPGKLEIRATKPMADPQDLSRAYSPGVAEACLEIKSDPARAVRYTSRGNLVAVISNGTAVLGLGDIGAQAAKPVMEGKAVLFKKFAGIDCFDIEISERDPARLSDIIASLEPTFGAVNLEDIKAPECFEVERLCREKMNVPVFHDDQHGTAIVVAAAVLNALKLVKKSFSGLKIVSTGGGAAGIACLDMLTRMGARRDNIWLIDRQGLVREGRAGDLTAQKARFAQASDKETLDDVIAGADLFLGLSAPDLLTASMVRRMAPDPVIFALANPDPEILPEVARKAAPGAIIATGRSDYPNQVNNVLCFPFIFRGALDVGATEINDAMKIACVEAMASLAQLPSSAEAAAAYRDEHLTFGPNYLIPKPFDPRLLCVIAPAVAKAAMESGVATRPLAIDAYRERLAASTDRTALIMRPVFEAARETGRRIVYTEGEDHRVIRTAWDMLQYSEHAPILIGRPQVIADRAGRMGLTSEPESCFEIVDPSDDPRFESYWRTYHGIMERKGVTPTSAKIILRTNTTVIAAIMVLRGEADSMICGVQGGFQWHLRHAGQILGTETLHPVGTLSLIMLESGALFVGDMHVNMEPGAQQIADTVLATARHIRRFGLTPKIAICSSSLFGSLDSISGVNARKAIAILDAMETDFEYEGEMHTDLALVPAIRARLFPRSRLHGRANALIYGTAEGAAAARNILKHVGNGIEVGPILMGMGNRVHILTSSATERDLLNSSALAATTVKSYG